MFLWTEQTGAPAFYFTMQGETPILGVFGEERKSTAAGQPCGK